MESDDEWPERSYWREAIKRHNAEGEKLKEKMPDVHVDFAHNVRNQQLTPQHVRFSTPPISAPAHDILNDERVVRLLDQCVVFLAVICFVMLTEFFISLSGMICMTHLSAAHASRAPLN